MKKPYRHHTHGGWWFTRMPNGDVMVSAGDGIQMVTLAPNEWASVVREMAEAYQSDTDSSAFGSSEGCPHTHREYGTAEEAGGGAWCLRCGEFIEDEPADNE